ncbi:MAG: multidrug ABC transporter [Bacteroidia bacterium]|nr:multidrug ABC transporter [Bacteroidia bacterium]
MYYLLVVISVLIASFSQMLLKSSSKAEHNSFLLEYLNWKVIGGYGLMFVSLFVNIFAMRRGVLVKEVSIIESLSYLFVPTLALFFFNEKINKQKVIAIAVIMVGVVVFFI